MLDSVSDIHNYHVLLTNNNNINIIIIVISFYLLMTHIRSNAKHFQKNIQSHKQRHNFLRISLAFLYALYFAIKKTKLTKCSPNNYLLNDP